jgi:hypothetical protein
MNSAILHNGQVVTAKEYIADIHGSRLYCIDKSCKTPVIFITGNETIMPHFKTTGKNDSKHVTTCGFYKPLSFIDTVRKVEEYQDDLLDRGIRETVIRVNLNKLDPDYQPKTIDKEENEDKKEEKNKIKVKSESETPATIGSLASVVKLITSYEPDILSSIIVNIKGNKMPISSIIIDQEEAHKLLWEKPEELHSSHYFVFGEVDAVLRREKVIYINFKPLNKVLFSIVLFDKYFKHFDYTDENLIGKKVLAWGMLNKNTYKDKNTTEIVIKSDKYIEILK